MVEVTKKNYALKRSALDGLLGKLDSQLNSERQRGTNFLTRSSGSSPLPTGNATIGQRGAGKSFNVVGGLRSNPKLDPLRMKPKVTKARQQAMRQARHNQINQIRHKGGNYNSRTDPDEYIGGNGNESESSFDDDDLKVVDEKGYKTMEWTEPDGSKTILKFDEDGALIGKEKASAKNKARPSKRQQDLKDRLELAEDKAKNTLTEMKRQSKLRQVSGMALNLRQQAELRQIRGGE